MTPSDTPIRFVKDTPPSQDPMSPDFNRSLLSYLLYLYAGFPDDERLCEILLEALRISTWADHIRTMSPRAAGQHLFSEASSYYRNLEAAFNGKKDVDIALCPELRKALEVKSFFSRNMESFHHCLDWGDIESHEGVMCFDSRFKLYRKETDKDSRLLYLAVLESLDSATLVYLYVLNRACATESGTLSDLITERLYNFAHPDSSTDTPKKEKPRNEPISTLLGWFEDKKSKRVSEARGKIRRRFDGQSFDVQKRILRSFLKGAASDVDWAACRLKERWIPSMEASVCEACLRSGEKKVSKLAVRNCSYDFVKQNIDFLSSHAGYDQVCLRLDAEGEAFRIDESRLSVPDLFYVMAKLGRDVEKSRMEELFFSFFLGIGLKVIGGASCELALYDKKVGLILWAAGRLGMTETLMKLHSIEAQARNDAGDKEDPNYREKFLYHFRRLILKKDYDEKDMQRFIAEHNPLAENNLYLDQVASDASEDELEEDLPVAFPEPVQKIIDDVLSKSNLAGREQVRSLSAETVSIIMDSSPEPDLSARDQWMRFIRKYQDRPRLYDILSKASVTEGAYYFVVNIVLSVNSTYQQEWLEKMVEDELRTSFIAATGRAFVFIDYENNEDPF